MYRTHTCGELRLSHDGQSVRLAGWLHRRRDHGGLIFLDVRDRYGLTQVVVDPSRADAYAAADRALRGEEAVDASHRSVEAEAHEHDQEQPGPAGGHQHLAALEEARAAHGASLLR